jgi:hypothetical protein
MRDYLIEYASHLFISGDITPIKPMREMPGVQIIYPMGLNQHILSRLISDVERMMCDIKKKHCS